MTRISKLLAAMTIEEKIGQLSMQALDLAVTGPIVTGNVEERIRSARIGSLLNIWGAEQVQRLQRIAVEETRLKIPLLIGLDVLHGHKMIFPIPLAETAAFDPPLWEASARAAAKEAADDGVTMTFAPMIDIARDPRWGRIAESPGEDPFVGAAYARAKVRGFQGGNGPGGLADAQSLAATAKHFCAYGAVQAGCDYAPADVSERLLHEVYLPPFAAAMAEGCAAVMPAFNNVAGIPMTAHMGLLRGWLRQTQGFNGVIVSDYNAIAELIRHGVAADLAEAAALSLHAGIDVDMMSGAYSEGLRLALDRGLVTLEMIDEAVRRVLTLKECLGLFDDPFARGGAAVASREGRKEHRALARELARRSVVVLANDGILPLWPDLRRLALIGPLADAPAEMLGPWVLAGDRAQATTIREGLAAALPHTEIICEPGCSIAGDDRAGIAAACDASHSADLVILCLGEAAHMSGEAASRADPGLPGVQAELASALFDLGKPAVVLLTSGRPLMIADIAARARALVATWFLGAEAGHAIADVLTGAFNPSGRLPVTWPRHLGQVPIFFSTRPSGRPADPLDRYTSKYLDMPVEPLFYFGHGLSYCRFCLVSLSTGETSVRAGGELLVAVEVSNEGPAAGETTVFLFLRALKARIARPVLELKGFAKIALAAHEKGRVSFKLTGKDFCYLAGDLEPLFEPGEFLLFAGQSADPKGFLSVKMRAVAG